MYNARVLHGLLACCATLMAPSLAVSEEATSAVPPPTPDVNVYLDASSFDPYVRATLYAQMQHRGTASYIREKCCSELEYIGRYDRGTTGKEELYRLRATIVKDTAAPGVVLKPASFTTIGITVKGHVSGRAYEVDQNDRLRFKNLNPPRFILIATHYTAAGPCPPSKECESYACGSPDFHQYHPHLVFGYSDTVDVNIALTDATWEWVTGLTPGMSILE